MKSNHLSLFYAGLILVLVLFSKVQYSAPEKPPLQESINSTTLSVPEPTVRYSGSPAQPRQFEVASVAFPPPPPEVRAVAVLAEEMNSGKRLLEKEPDKHWPLASLTKLMTAIVAIEKIGVEKVIAFDEQALATEGIGGGWQAGDRATVSQLIQTMMMVSSNDAAAALANYYGAPAFLEEMRFKAAALSMVNTQFADVSGLSVANQSTPEDVRKLIHYIFSHHLQIWEWSRQSEIEILGRKLLNINKFAGRPEWLGGKTGFLDEAGGNLISIFEHQNQPILVIVFGAEDRFAETEKIYDYFRGN